MDPQKSTDQQEPKESPAAIVEANFLHAFIVDEKNRAKLASMVRPEMLEVERHKFIYRTALKIQQDGGKVNSTTIILELKKAEKLTFCGGPAGIKELFQGASDPKAGEDYAKGVRDLAQRRAVLMECDWVSASIMSGNWNPGEAAERIMRALSLQDGPTSAVPIGEIVDGILEKLNDQGSTEAAVARFGIPEIDERMSFVPGQVTVLAARPSGGKSSFMREVSLKASQEGPVLIFSAEVTMTELTTLMISQRARVDYERALTGKLKEEELEPFITHAGDIHELPIRIYPNLDISAMDVRLQVKNEIAQGRKPVLVAVDYLGLMEHPQVPGNRHDLTIAATTKAMKKIALQCGVPVLLLVQLNRENEKRATEEEYSRPRLSDLRDSGSIEQDADNVLFLWLKEKGAEHAPVSRRMFTVAKRRNGPTFEAELMFDRAAGHFYAANPSAPQTTAQDKMYAKAAAATNGGAR